MKAIDSEAIEILRSFGGAKLVRDMIALFVAGTPVRLDAARAAAASGDADGVRRAAHSLKSSAGQFGAREMETLCGQAEVLAAEGRDDELFRIVPEIERSFETARQELATIAG